VCFERLRGKGYVVRRMVADIEADIYSSTATVYTTPRLRRR
jgi:hypothetical protein